MDTRGIRDDLRRRPAAIALALLAVGVTTSSGQTVKPSEYEVKAVYLYNFARFVRWPAPRPPEEETAFTVCVLGEDPFGPVLDRTLAGESLDGKPAATKRIESVEEVEGCRIVFIGESEERRLDGILEALNGMSVLTVSDIEGFSRRGGMIELVLDDDRVRFEVDLTAVTRVRLDLSSELLKVARAVRRESSFRWRGPVRTARRATGRLPGSRTVF